MRLSFQGEGLLQRLGVLLGMAPRPMFEGYATLLMARALMAGASLGVFSALGERPQTAAELSNTLNVDQQGLELLLTALQTLRYMKCRNGRYSLTRDAKKFLDPRSKTSVHPWVGVFSYDIWEDLGRLESVLRGSTTPGAHTRPPADTYWDRYMAGMHALASITGPALARAIPTVDRPGRLLDLAGGHGRFSVEMCKRYPRLTATIIDLEGAAQRGHVYVEKAGMADRITYRHGDMFTDELGSNYDHTMVNNVLHMLDPHRCRMLLDRARGALRPGGKLSILEVERPPTGRRGDQFGSLLGLVFYALDHTPTYTAQELADMASAAGFVGIEVKRPVRLGGNVLVVGANPG